MACHVTQYKILGESDGMSCYTAVQNTWGKWWHVMLHSTKYWRKMVACHVTQYKILGENDCKTRDTAVIQNTRGKWWCVMLHSTKYWGKVMPYHVTDSEYKILGKSVACDVTQYKVLGEGDGMSRYTVQNTGGK